LGVYSARDALAAALAEMVASDEITEVKALEIARGYLRDNALSLYPPAPQ
jgi:stage V sporulation protein SpoVS